MKMKMKEKDKMRDEGGRDGDGMIAWVLGELDGHAGGGADGGADGLSIEALFSSFEDSFANGDPAQLWQRVLQSSQLEIGDDAKTRAALGKLALSDVLDLGLGSKLIRAKRRDGSGDDDDVGAKAPRTRKSRGGGVAAAIGPETPDVNPGLGAGSGERRRISTPKKAQMDASPATRTSSRGKKSAGLQPLDDGAVQDTLPSPLPSTPVRKGRSAKRGMTGSEQTVGAESIDPFASPSNGKDAAAAKLPEGEPQLAEETEAHSQRRASARGRRKAVTSPKTKNIEMPEMENVQLPETPAQSNAAIQNAEQEDVQQPDHGIIPTEENNQIVALAESVVPAGVPPKRKRGRPPGKKTTPAAATLNDADVTTEHHGSPPDVGGSQAANPSADIAETPTSSKKQTSRASRKKNRASLPASTGAETAVSATIHKDNLASPAPNPSEADRSDVTPAISTGIDVESTPASIEPHNLAPPASTTANTSSSPVFVESQPISFNPTNTESTDSLEHSGIKRKRGAEVVAASDKKSNTRKKAKKTWSQGHQSENSNVAPGHSADQPPTRPSHGPASSDFQVHQSSSNAAHSGSARGGIAPGEYMSVHFQPPKPYQSPFSAAPPPTPSADRPAGLQTGDFNAGNPNFLPQSLAPPGHVHAQNSPKTMETAKVQQQFPGRIEHLELQRQQTETLMRSYKSPFASAPPISPHSQPVQSSSSASSPNPQSVPPSQAARTSNRRSEIPSAQMEMPELENQPDHGTAAGIKPEPAQSPETRHVLPRLQDSSAVQMRIPEVVPPSNAEVAAVPTQSPAQARDLIHPSPKSSPPPDSQPALSEVVPHPKVDSSAVPIQTSAQAVNTSTLSENANLDRPSSERQGPIAGSTSDPIAAGTSSAPTENSAWAMQRQQASVIHTGVAQAQAISFPDDVARLASYYDEGPGNLVLSNDKSYLQFVGINQFPPQLPAFTTRISQLAEDPIISIRKGAKTDNLQIRVNDGATVAVRHVFKTVHRDDASNGVDEMREKIINARLFIEFNGDLEEAELAQKKPFKCNKCGLRLKNKNGLEYHLTKAATICNPNFDPSSVIGKAKKRGPQPKLGIASPSPKPAATKAPKTPKTPKSPKITPSRPRAARAKAVKRYGDDGSGSSSEDSVMEWAASVATQGVESKSAPALLPAKKYRALPGETALLERLAESFQKDTVEDDGDLEEEASTTVTHFTQELCEEVLMRIISSNNGIFPGDRGIWYGLFSVWAKDYSSLAPPESKLCSSVLDELVADERLKRVDFQFPDLKSRITTRSIYLMPQVEIQSPIVEMMKELIRNTYPRYYVPSQFTPPAPIHKKLEALDHRTLGTKPTEADVRVLGSSSAEDSADSGDNFGSSSADEDSLIHGTGDPSTFAGGLDEDMDLDSDVYLESTSLGNRKRSVRNSPRKSRGLGSNNIAKWHARRKMEEKSPFPRPKNKPGGSSLKVSRKKDKSSGIQVWATAPSYLPNPESGAWNTVPVKVDPPKKPRELYRGRLLAEPLTFLQDLNGAWSHRPFGHGARPIYSRPLRRVDGNPTQQTYLSKIQNGHRPVLYPPTKNQMHFPAALSKRLPKRTTRAATTQKIAVSTPALDTLDDEDSEDAYVPEDEDPIELSDAQARRRSSSFSSSASSVETGSLTEDPLSDGPPAKRTRKAAATYGRSRRDLDEVQIVNFYEPRKLGPDGQRNPGLDSMPFTFGLSVPGQNSPDDDTHQLESYTLTFVEPQIANLDSNFVEGSWTVASSDSPQQIYVKIIFDSETAFDVENLPYELLTIDDTLDEAQSAYTRSSASRRTANTPSKARRLNLHVLQRLNTSRFMTALPIDFRGVLNEPSEAFQDFGVQVANPSSVIQSRKRFRGTDELSSEAEARFIVFVVVVRTVTGGLDQLIDWVLLSTYYPDHSINYLNKLWNRLSAKKKDLIDDLVVDFQDAFLVAYKNGTVPPIDFDNLVGYNWAELVDWTFSNIDTSLTKKVVHLPANRKEVEKIYHYKEHDREDNDVQETYFGLAAAVYKRMEAVTSIANSIPVLASTSTHEDISDFMIAKSCARATALTPQSDWNASVAKAKLAQAGVKIVAKALDELAADKVLSKRKEAQQSAGRSYEEGDALTFLGKKQIQPKALAEAHTYKEFLDAEFRSGKPCVRADYMGNEGSYMCVTSLMAHRSLKLVGVDIPMNEWGLGDEDTGYETKKIPKSRLRWEMDMYPTDTYVFNDNNASLQNMQSVEPPRGSQAGEIPIWYGITGSLIPLIWCRILVSVSGLVALRSGITTQGLKKALKPVLESWEIRLLLEWGAMMGIFQKLGQGEGIEGWGVGEMWWSLVGSVCAGQTAALEEAKPAGEKEEDDDEEDLI